VSSAASVSSSGVRGRSDAEVDVDAVGLQAAQAVFDFAQDVAPVQPFAVDALAHAKADLAGDHQFVAVAGHELTEQRFGAPAPVDIGAVEEVDAGVAAAGIECGRSRFVGVAAKGHRRNPSRRRAGLQQSP
jgi:hypothetical protein